MDKKREKIKVLSFETLFNVKVADQSTVLCFPFLLQKKLTLKEFFTMFPLIKAPYIRPRYFYTFSISISNLTLKRSYVNP